MSRGVPRDSLDSTLKCEASASDALARWSRLWGTSKLNEGGDLSLIQFAWPKIAHRTFALTTVGVPGWLSRQDRCKSNRPSGCSLPCPNIGKKATRPQEAGGLPPGGRPFASAVASNAGPQSGCGPALAAHLNRPDSPRLH